MSKYKTTNCKQCGQSFEHKSRLQRKFCSRSCYYQHQRDNPETTGLYDGGKSRIEVTCANCDKKIVKKQADLDRTTNLFCDVNCHNEWQRNNPRNGTAHHQWDRVDVTCEVCGTVVKKWPSHVKKYKHQFCSNKCRHTWLKQSGTQAGENNPAWRGGYFPYYGPGWQDIRNEIRHRDNYTCQDCGRHESEFSEQLHVHHITPFREFNGNFEKANRQSNLTSLCRICHTKLEWQT